MCNVQFVGKKIRTQWIRSSWFSSLDHFDIVYGFLGSLHVFCIRFSYRRSDD